MVGVAQEELNRRAMLVVGRLWLCEWVGQLMGSWCSPFFLGGNTVFIPVFFLAVLKVEMQTNNTR